MGNYGRWRAEQEVDSGTLAFEEWVGGTLKSNTANVETPVDVDSLLLCTKLS